MKYRLVTLLAILSLVIPQMDWEADAKEKTSAERTAAPLFNKVAPLPGALAVSADGRIAAHISTDGDIIIWDTAQAKPLETISSKGKLPSAVSLSPDGNMLAVGYFDARLIVQSRPGKKPLREFFGHSGRISALSFSLDGQMLASGGDDATTQLWDIASGRRLRVFDSKTNDDISTGSGIPVSIGFSGDGKALIVNEWYSRFYDVERGTTIWDTAEGIEISTRNVAPPNRDNTMRAGQSLGGKGWLLAFTGREGLMVERLDSCAPSRRLPSGGYANTVASDPLGRWVAATGDEKITFFSLDDKTRRYAITLPSKAIALAPHPDGKSLFTLTVADIQRNGDEHFIFGRDAETVTEGALYRIPVPAPLWRSPPLSIEEGATHCAPSEATRLQQDFRLPDKPLELAVIAKLVPTKEMATTLNNPPRELHFWQNDKLYVLYHAQPDFGDGLGAAEWNLQTERPVRVRFKQYTDTTMRLKEGWVVLSKTLENLLTGKPFYNFGDTERQGNSTTVSDMDTGEVFRVAKGHFERYASDGRRLKDVKINGTVGAFAARNGKLAALYVNGNVQVWPLEPRGASKIYKLDLKSGGNDYSDHGAEDLALSADARYLQIAFPNPSGDGPTHYLTYRLDAAKPVGYGQLLTPFPGRANRGVIADTRPHRLAVWDFDKAEIIARLPRHRSRDKNGESQPLRTAISDDGRLLASASYDGLVRIWDIDARQMIGERRAGGEVTAIAFDSAGQRLAAGRKDGQIVILQIKAQNKGPSTLEPRSDPSSPEFAQQAAQTGE